LSNGLIFFLFLLSAPGDAAGCLEYLRSVFRIDEVPDDVAMLAMARN